MSGVQQKIFEMLAKAYALDVIRRRLRPDIKVNFVALAEAPFTEAGKFILYKSELAKFN